MKRLFFLLIVVVASVLPQSVWAAGEASYDDQTKTLTINSVNAGNTSSYLAPLSLSAEQKAAVTKIVLSGKFNESDLQSIQNSAGFTGVTEVDMADAQFVLTSSGAPDQAYYNLYNTAAPSSGTIGDRIIVGGTLYKSAQGGQWNQLSNAPAEGTTVVSGINTSATTGYVLDTYGRPTDGTAKYVQMNITYEWSDPHSIPVPESAFDLTHNGDNEILESDINSTLLESYQEGQSVYIYWYYYSSNTNGSWKWVRGSKSDYDDGTTKFDNPTDADIEHLSHYYAGEGKVFRVKVYYTKQATRTWTDKPDGDSDPTSYTDCSQYEYEYRNNHKDGYPVNNSWHSYTDGEWVKLTAWTYYEFKATNPATWYWEQVAEYTDGESHYINVKYTSGTDPNTVQDNLPNAINQYAVVMGTELYYASTNDHPEGEWVDPSTVSNTPHYVDMKFSYWSATLQKATTSKYADEDINPDIFQNCNLLTDVDFKAGIVKGFGDHTAPANALTVNIGQNVTAIASNAFIRCTALKAVTFDAGNGSETISGKTYPLALEIRDGAFQACENLKNVVIPNRVTVIGNDAFKEAGGKTAGTEFKVTFQRRYTDDTKETAIDGWKEGMNLTIGTDAFAYCKNLKEISLPIRMTSMGDGIFQNSGLEKYEIREDIEEALVTTIPSNAFLACKLKEINIPRSVTLIESGAFSNTPTIETIRFQKQLGSTQNPLTIKAGAFSGGDEQHQALKDVYVEFSHTERMVICEYNAFNFTSMVGQTNTENRQFAKLHFPKEDWDYYQGNWKRGLAFRQDNLNAFKDGYTGEWGGQADPNNELQNCVGFGTAPIDPATGKYTKEGYTGENAKYIAPANGWQQFAYSDTDIDILIPWGSFKRTFSTTTPYVIPTYATTETSNGITVQAGAQMFKIYRITAFSDGWTSGLDKTSAESAQNSTRVAKALEVNDNDRSDRAYIPSETGLMMVGLINADYIVYFADADFTSTGSEKTEKKYPYNLSDYDYTNTANLNANNSKDINLLYPSCIDNQRMDGLGGTSAAMTGEPKIVDDDGVSKILLRSSIPCPYHSYDSDLKFRLFGYSSASNQFKRVNNALITRDKAYLKLPKELFHWANEYNSGTSGGSSSGVEDPTAAAAAREISLSFLEDEEESETTGIKQVDTTIQRTDSNVFYTLEGVKLNSRPTQRGIYIHNGRKVVIK